MMRSLFSGVSGLKVHQTRMDVIGNNIANINTIGFKSSRTTFSDMLSQIQSSAAAPTDGRGGVNAKQIGLGVNVESIDIIFTDSSPQQTGKNTDLALSGNGLFVLSDGSQSYYTRNGAFSFDESGYYVMPGNGLRVQGWNAENDGTINTNGTAVDVVVPVGKTMEATATTSIEYSGNLNKESLLIDKISFVSATGISQQEALDKVGTGTIYNPQSINVDGENVLAATLTMKDGTTMNVTSGYYEVGRSIPITTLATVYDSLGGRHEVTVLIDKDPTTEDEGANTAAQETSNRSAAFYTDENGIEYQVTKATGSYYQYTDADGETQYVTADAVVKGAVADDGTIYPVTANTATVYSYDDDAGTTHYVTAANVKTGILTDDGNYVATAFDDSVYEYEQDGETLYAIGDDAVEQDTDTGTYYIKGTEIEATKIEEPYTYTDATDTVHYISGAGATENSYALIEGTYTQVNQVEAEDAAYKYTVGEGDDAEDIYVPESAVINCTNTDDGYVEVSDVDYTYVDSDGDRHYLSSEDVTERAVYDNRWRVYLAPGVGEPGPASANFNNIVETTESDGTTMTATMNYDAETEKTEVTYLYFDEKGQFVTNGRSQDAQITFTYGNGNGAGDNVGIIDFTGMTQYANSTTSFPITNGNSAGILQSLAIDGNGIVSGTYTNGLVRQEAQIAVAQFSNASGLTRVGTTIYQQSNNSGLANVKTIADFGLNVVSSALEMSNVDLATEFSDMIVTQRGFQANSKMTTTSDEMLETLVNMKR